MNSNNKIIPVLIGIIAVLLIGFGIALGVFLGSGRNKKDDAANSTAATSPPATEATTVTEVEETTEPTTITEPPAETTEKATETEKTTEAATKKADSNKPNNSVDYHIDHRSGAGSDFTFAENDGAGGQINTQSDPLNLRAKPDQNAEIIAKMPKGCSVGILGSNSDWYYIHYTENGTSYYGYASRQYVRNLQAEAKADNNSQSNNSQSVDYHTDHRSGAYSGFPFFSSPASGVVFTESGTLNLRAKPDTNANIIASMPKGTYVDVLGDDGSWCYIRYTENGTSYYGYASKQFINDGGI